MGEVLPQVSLDDLVFRAHREFEAVVSTQEKFFLARLRCGQTLWELRRRIEAGEVGDVRWWDWYGQRFARSQRDAERVMDLANQEDPAAAYAATNAKRRDYRQQRSVAIPANFQPSDTGVAKNKPTESKPRPALKVVTTEEPPTPALREHMIEAALDLVRQMTRAERLAFVTRLKKVYRE